MNTRVGPVNQREVPRYGCRSGGGTPVPPGLTGGGGYILAASAMVTQCSEPHGFSAQRTLSPLLIA